MTERWERVRELAAAALELPPDERASFLERECLDAALRAEVLSLTAASDDAPDFLEDAALLRFVVDAQDPAEGLVGTTAGPYRLTAHLASGGMGSVYRAARGAEPDPGQLAIKVIKAGLDTAGVLARFAAEREALSALDDPGIVTLLDAGALDDGRPFLVMELVDGLPIDEYCAQHALPLAERLELVERVCAAVQAAHRGLVLHRDLKPANILVAPGGAPKLLDFGVAKLLDPGRSPTVTTRTAQRAPLTPAYASPEQLAGERSTTATDVYALGVVLGELACPDLRPGGDLETVVRMATRPEPERRYASVDRLAEDVARVRTGRPVLARPDSLGYRARRFAARHRVALAATSLVLLSLVVAVVSTGIGLRRARAGEMLAWRAHAQAISVSRYFRDVLGAADPRALRGDPGFVAGLERAAAEVGTELAGYPEAEGRVRTELGALFMLLERWEEAREQLALALELARTTRGFGRGDEERIQGLLDTCQSHLGLSSY